jgi:hypothetical protein
MPGLYAILALLQAEMLRAATPHRIARVSEEAKAPPPEVDTRQSRRRLLFEQAFREISLRYGGEPRFRRRAIARDLAKRRWKERKG